MRQFKPMRNFDLTTLHEQVGSQYSDLVPIHIGINTASFIACPVGQSNKVFIKFFAADAMSAGARARWQHDAAIRSELRCESLARILHFKVSRPYLHVVMPELRGENLGGKLERGPLPIDDVLRLGIHVCKGLQALHHRGVHHRGVKPSNIFLTRNDSPFAVEQAVLVNFGNLRNVQAGQIATERDCMNVAYLSPEESGALDCDVGPASDLYSTGILLFHALTGRPPFFGSHVGNILFEQLTADVPSLLEFDPSIPRELDELVQRLLRKEPGDRYQLAEAVITDLETIATFRRLGVKHAHFAIGATDCRSNLIEPAYLTRADEHTKMQGVIKRTREGSGSLMAVEGESGSGKTRLLTEFSKLAHQAGFWIVKNEATTNSAQGPFQLLDPIVERFLTAAKEDAGFGEAVAARLGDLTSALCDAFPKLCELESFRTGASNDPDVFGERRIIEAVARFFDAIGSRKRPVLLILDDCQWAGDIAHKLLLRWLNLRSERDSYTTIVVGYRSEEVGVGHPLRALQYQSIIKIGRFLPQELDALAESMAGKLPSKAREIVQRFADGNPFMASAVLRGLVESGALVSKHGTWQIQPEAMADIQSSKEAATLLTKRIELLNPTAIHLLSVGAVIGKEFMLNLAASLTEMQVGDAIEALGQARERKLIWVRPDGGSFVFVHDRIRAAFLDRLSEAERRALHGCAALWLQEHHPDASTEIAFHFDEAGNAEQALPFALASAKKARKHFSLEVAEQQYRIARRGARQGKRDLRFAITKDLGDTLMLRGKYACAAPLFEEASRDAQSPMERAQIETKLAELSFKRGDMENATKGFEKALGILGFKTPQRPIAILMFLVVEAIRQVLHTLFPSKFLHRMERPANPSEVLAMQLFSLLTHGCWYCRSKPQCLWAHLRGLNLAEKFPPSPELAHAYSEHAPVMCLVPLFERATRYALRSLELRTEFQDLWGQGQSLNFYSCVLYAASRFKDCVEKGREAIRLLEKTGDYWQVHIARYQVAAALYRLGYFQEALQEAKKNHQSGIELGDEQASGIILDVWARACKGEIPVALLEVEMQRARHDAQRSTQVLLAAGIVDLAEQRFERGIARLEQACKEASHAGIQNAYTLPAMAWVATAYRKAAMAAGPFGTKEYRRNVSLGIRAARRSLRKNKLCANDAPRALRELAILLALQGRYRRARRAMDQSVQIAHDQAAMYELSKSLEYRGRIGQVAQWKYFERDLEEANRIAVSMKFYQVVPRERTSSSDLATLSLADRFDGVLAAGRRIALALTADRVYEEARTAALRLLRGERCEIILLERDEGADESEYQFRFEGNAFLRERVRRTIEAGGAISFSTSDRSEQGGEEYGKEKSALCVPIKIRSRPAACLYVTHHEVRNLFGKDEEKLANFVATIASAALENAEGFHDLAELNRTLEQRVAERTAAAEAANHAKSRFLATMSHEIRTPMNGILGMTDIALRTPLTSQQRNCLSIVRQSGDALLNLLNDILDISKIEAGKMELEQVSMEPREVIEAAVKLMGVPATAKRIELTCFVSNAVPREIRADPHRLRQILVNLIGNAIKFTESGFVAVKCDWSKQETETGELLISIRDTGPGIPKDKQEKIFHSFEQSDSSTTRRYGGTGLGLAICAEFVSLMQGKIWVESEIGHGSTFHIRVPVQVLEASNDLATKLHQKHVIVISDNPHVRSHLRDRFEALGASCHVETAHEHGETVFAEDGKWDYWVIDHAANAVDPEKLRRQLDAFADKDTSILVFVPIDQFDSFSGCKECGANVQFVAKPCSTKELLDALALNDSNAESTQKPVCTWKSEGSPSLRILVADDADVNQEVARGIIELLGHHCEVACNGLEAVALFQQNGYDIIFMDLEMPEIDGEGATAMIRQWEQIHGLTRTPIVAMTAHALSGTRERCLKSGMDDYIAKPIHAEAVMEKLVEFSKPRSLMLTHGAANKVTRCTPIALL